MITLALFGTCGHQNAVLAELAAAGGFALVGAAPVTPDDDIPKAVALWREKAPDAPAPDVFDSPEALLAALRPDVAVIAPRLDQIACIATLAARAGCHVIAEKPLALSLDSLDALWRAISDAGVQCAAMLSNREHPVLAAALAAIRDGAIGRVVLLNARKSYRWGVRPAWFGDRALYGGTLPWIGIHALDFIHAAADSPFASISARHANLGHPERPGCEDACLLEATLESGALASASIDYFRPASALTHGDDWLRIVGTEGILEASMDRGHCHIIAPLSSSLAPLREGGCPAVSPCLAPLREGGCPAGAGGSTPCNRMSGEAPFSLPLPPRAPTFAPWLRSLPPRGTPSAPNATTRRAFLLTQAALVARESADTGRCLPVPAAPWR